jgi:hypothetical protein
MKRYRVRFLKVIPDATGHEHRMCQQEFEIEAESEEAAIEEAKALFSVGEQSADWTLRADKIEAEAL